MKHPILALLLGTLACGLIAQDVRLVAPDYPPYTMKVQDSVAGTGMVLITRLFKEANIPFTARPTSNYSRALLDLSHGEADGFFQAAKTLERDAVADYLQIGINAWSWSLNIASLIMPHNQATLTERIRGGSHAEVGDRKPGSDEHRDPAGDRAV